MAFIAGDAGMNGNYPRVPIYEILRVHYGKALQKEKRDESGDFSVYGSSGFIGNHNEFLTEIPTLIIGRKGSVGSITHAAQPSWTIDTAFYTESIRANQLDIRYLFYALKNANLEQHTITTSIPGLSRDAIYKTEIPLPSLEVQKRIASILDAADALRAKRRESLQKLEVLLKSVFLEMFGDPVIEGNGWGYEKIEGFIAEGKNKIRTGPFGSQLLHSEFTEDENGIAVIGIDTVVRNNFEWKKIRFITTEKYKELKRYTVSPRDVLITIMGTTGRVAIVPEKIPASINTKHLCCITLDEHKCFPEYLKHCLLMHPKVLQQISASEKGAIMPGLNMAIIKGISIPNAPFEKQKEFSEFARQLEHEKLQAQDSSASLETLFSSLQDQAFNGTLDSAAPQLAQLEVQTSLF
jgi:type I restriction enzyme, S subunit